MNTKQLIMSYKENIEKEKSIRDCFIEVALYNLLKEYEADIIGLIESDSDGEWFHKAFRQVDVTPSSNIDMAIWNLLQEAPVFWSILNEAKK